MLLTLMGNNWMFATERSGWWRLKVAEMTQKSLDERNAARHKEELKLHENTKAKVVKQPKRKFSVVKGSIKRPAPESFIPEPTNTIIAPIAKPIQPSMYEIIGSMDFTTYSTAVYNTVIKQPSNVVDLKDRRKIRQKREEEFLILLAA